MRRTVLFVSDGTAITAETFGQSLLTQFAGQEFRRVRLPFVDTESKARDTVDLINRSARPAHTRSGRRTGSAIRTAMRIGWRRPTTP